MKPRITTDGSFGGPDSMNACVPDLERGVTLPSAQTFGRVPEEAEARRAQLTANKDEAPPRRPLRPSGGPSPDSCRGAPEGRQKSP
jgi:hypothetical protein